METSVRSCVHLHDNCDLDQVFDHHVLSSNIQPSLVIVFRHVYHIGIFCGSHRDHICRVSSIILLLATAHRSRRRRNMHQHLRVLSCEWHYFCIDRCHDSMRSCSNYLETTDAEDTTTRCHKHIVARWLVSHLSHEGVGIC